jgi:phosphatidylserine/phosphatidylglycerophosphate/cardiolipin synthase-like enzyme
MRATFVKPVRPVAKSIAWYRWFAAMSLRRFSIATVALALVALGLNVPAVMAAGTSNALTTYVEPAAGFGFLDHAVLGAKHTIELSMYELEDPTMESDLVARAHAGVGVKVVLDSEYGISSVNEPATRILTRGGVHVVFAPSSQIFHAKYLITDGSALYIGTANFTAQYYSSTRDFWILDRNHADITAATATFAADFTHRSAPLGAGSGGLVWSPGSTNALVNLIDSAKHSLLVENEEMDSYTIESALEAAASRGVDVDVVMNYDSEWHAALSQLAQAGVHVRVHSSSQVYIHAKVICADCNSSGGTVFVGSENFSTSSLDYNRELGIITSVASVIRSIRSTVLGDYAQGSSRF